MLPQRALANALDRKAGAVIRDFDLHLPTFMERAEKQPPFGGLAPGALPQSVATAGINNTPGFMALFSTHPPMEARIAALQSRQ